jgi:hypothetical protein
MNQLQYAEDVVKRGFTGFQWQNQFNQNFADESRKSIQQQIDSLFTLANQHRCDNVPEFADESKYLPVKEVSPKEKVEAIVSIVPVDLKESELATAKPLTQPPIQQTKQDDLLNAVLLGLGIVVVLKILS